MIAWIQVHLDKCPCGEDSCAGGQKAFGGGKGPHEGGYQVCCLIPTDLLADGLMRSQLEFNNNISGSFADCVPGAEMHDSILAC